MPWLQWETDSCYEGKVYLCVFESLPLLLPLCMQSPQRLASWDTSLPSCETLENQALFLCLSFLTCKMGLITMSHWVGAIMKDGKCLVWNQWRSSVKICEMDRLFLKNWLIKFVCAGSLLLCGLSPVAVSTGSSLLWSSDFPSRWLLSLRAQALGHEGFSSCSMWAPSLCLWGSVALGNVKSSWTRDPTCVLCIGRQILIHCATREVLEKRLMPTPKDISKIGEWMAQAT